MEKVWRITPFLQTLLRHKNIVTIKMCARCGYLFMRWVLVNNISKLPISPGVYFLLNARGEIFYIGKSTNIRTRVQDHMRLKAFHGGIDFVQETARVGWEVTESEIEALLKEAGYIKKYRPKFNVLLKDDKKYFYVGIVFPKNKRHQFLPYIFLTHQPKTNSKGTMQNAKLQFKIQHIIYVGPFTEGKSLKHLLRYLRKAFPYYTKQKHGKLKCSYCHLGLCPGPNSDMTHYRRNLSYIRRILEGKYHAVEKQLERQMKDAAKKLEFEQAQDIKKTLNALQNIFAHQKFLAEDVSTEATAGTKVDTSVIKASRELGRIVDASGPIETIEGYDISNMQGKNPTASMVRFDNGAPNKSLYRRFRMRLPETPNDVAMIREVVSRRLNHPEWPYPDLLLIDGGKGQLNAALAALGTFALETKKKRDALPHVASLAKRENELFVPDRPTSIRLDTDVLPATRNVLMYVRDESHRFARAHYRTLHRKIFQKT